MATQGGRQLSAGIGLMLLSALSSCTGQLMWKLAGLDRGIIYYLAGFALYGLGALLMVAAFRFGEMSVLHPMLSVGFVISVFLGAAVLGEQISLRRGAGILLIIGGMVLLGCAGAKERGRP